MMIVLALVFVFMAFCYANNSRKNRQWGYMTAGIYLALMMAGGVGLSSGSDVIRSLSPYVMFTGIFAAVIYFIAINFSKITVATRWHSHKVI